jgi:hypothetical protein
MPIMAYCMDCGEQVTPGSKRCPKCGQIFAWGRRERGHDENPYAVYQREGIMENLKLYGTHPQCRHCRFPCKNYNAPNSKILYCPKILLAPELEMRYNNTVIPLHETL